jgi:hypothetical protein
MNNEITIRKLPPAWFIRIISKFRQSLLWLNKRSFPAGVVLYEHFQYFWLLPCIRVAAELDVAGLLKQGPKSIEELASLTGSNQENLFRLIRALSSQDIFKFQKNGLVTNTRLSKALIDGKGSLRHMIMQHLGTLNWSVFNELSHSVRTGGDAFNKVFGEQIYDYLSKHPEESGLFDRSMTNLSELSLEPIVNAYDFSRFHTLADIGGGEGLLLSSILFTNPKLQGILFDLPEGLTHTKQVTQKYGVTARMKIIPGNFFKNAPTGADGYLLKNILHNWGDEECRSILQNLKTVLPDNGKILILEMVLDEGNAPSFGKLVDIQMMVFMHSGKERTAREFQKIIEGAGLRMKRIIPTIAPLSIIEVTL